MSKHHHTYLALGDSYTIGESVPLYESFPYQTVQMLRKAGKRFHAPEILAKTGWTTGELAEQILQTKFSEYYDFVTLLIGVNNQYRGLSIDDFKADIDYLIHKAIHITAGVTENVIVLSIPDWGVTPFAKGKDHKKISKEIDEYNLICEATAKQYKTQYINITDETRKANKDLTLLAGDHLHYSEKEHSIWARHVASAITAKLSS